jgi:WD40 repeat protein
MWDAAMGDIVAGPFIGHSMVAFSVAFSPDGQCIASASGDHMIHLWSVTIEEVVTSFPGHSGVVMSVTVSPNCQHITSSSADLTIYIWDATTGEVITSIRQANLVCSVAFSPDG